MKFRNGEFTVHVGGIIQRVNDIETDYGGKIGVVIETNPFNNQVLTMLRSEVDGVGFKNLTLNCYDLIYIQGGRDDV